MADSEPELVEVRLAGPVSARLNATFLPLAQSSVQDLIKQLLEEDGEQIKREILGSEAETGAGDHLRLWGIQQSSRPTQLTGAAIEQFQQDKSHGKYKERMSCRAWGC